MFLTEVVIIHRIDNTKLNSDFLNYCVGIIAYVIFKKQKGMKVSIPFIIQGRA